MRAIFVVLVVSLVGCRGLLLGSPCDAGTPQCTGAKTAAFCEADAGWVEYVAPGGCTEANGVMKVDFSGATGACPNVGADIGSGRGLEYSVGCDGANAQLVCSDPIVCTQGPDGGCTVVPRVWKRLACDSCSVEGGLVQCHPSQGPVEGKQCPFDQQGASYCDSKTSSITCSASYIWTKASCPGGCKDVGTTKNPVTTCN